MNDGDDVIVGREPVPGSPSKVRVILRQRGAWVVNLSTWVDLNLRVGAVVDERLGAAIEEAVVVDGALDTALRYLSGQRRTSHEMEAYLKRKGLTHSASAQVLKRLRERGWIDDGEYARAFVEEKQRVWSRLEIVSRLAERGLSMPADGSADNADSAREAEWSAAMHAARKHWRSHAKDEAPKRRRKLMAYLQRRGFPAPIIRDVVKRLSGESAEGIEVDTEDEWNRT